MGTHIVSSYYHLFFLIRTQGNDVERLVLNKLDHCTASKGEQEQSVLKIIWLPFAIFAKFDNKTES